MLALDRFMADAAPQACAVALAVKGNRNEIVTFGTLPLIVHVLRAHAAVLVLPISLHIEGAWNMGSSREAGIFACSAARPYNTCIASSLKGTGGS